MYGNGLRTGIGERGLRLLLDESEKKRMKGDKRKKNRMNKRQRITRPGDNNGEGGNTKGQEANGTKSVTISGKRRTRNMDGKGPLVARGHRGLVPDLLQQIKKEPEVKFFLDQRAYGSHARGTEAHIEISYTDVCAYTYYLRS